MKVKLKVINMISLMENDTDLHSKKEMSLMENPNSERAKVIDVSSKVLVCQATVSYNV